MLMERQLERFAHSRTNIRRALRAPRPAPQQEEEQAPAQSTEFLGMCLDSWKTGCF